MQYQLASVLVLAEFGQLLKITVLVTITENTPQNLFFFIMEQINVHNIAFSMIYVCFYLILVG